MAAIGGSFLGLLIGGVLAPIDWRLVFLVAVPFGVFGTVWAYLKLEDNGRRVRGQDRLGGQHHLRRWPDLDPDRDHLQHPALRRPLDGLDQPGRDRGPRGWGLATLIIVRVIEFQLPDPMFRLHLFKIRAFTAGNLANLLGALGRGGIQFILIIWLQGIWLPQHGYSFARTPLWAGIYMVPLTIGFLVAGPISGILSDRYGARPFATGGMLVGRGRVLPALHPADQLRLSHLRRHPPVARTRHGCLQLARTGPGS